MAFLNSLTRLLPLFSNPDGALIPGNVDSDGRLVATISPFADPNIAFQFNDASTGALTRASVTVPGVAGVQRVVTGLSASLSASVASQQFRVTLNDSIGGDVWGCELMVTANNSSTVVGTNLIIVGGLGASLTLEFDQVTVAGELQSVFIGGINFVP